MKLESIDHDDLLELEGIERTLGQAFLALNEAIDAETDLEIILLEELKKLPDINDSLSPKNKFLLLRRHVGDLTVEKWVDDWIRAVSTKQKAKNTVEQIKGLRDSKKTKINNLPK